MDGGNLDRPGVLTLGGMVSGGGQQINNVIIGTVTPLAGFHIALRFRDRCKGGSTSADRLLNISGPITGGVNAYGVMINGTVQSGDIRCLCHRTP